MSLPASQWIRKCLRYRSVLLHELAKWTVFIHKTLKLWIDDQQDTIKHFYPRKVRQCEVNGIHEKSSWDSYFEEPYFHWVHEKQWCRLHHQIWQPRRLIMSTIYWYFQNCTGWMTMMPPSSLLSKFKRSGIWSTINLTCPSRTHQCNVYCFSSKLEL